MTLRLGLPALIVAVLALFSAGALVAAEAPVPIKQLLRALRSPHEQLEALELLAGLAALREGAQNPAAHQQRLLERLQHLLPGVHAADSVQLEEARQAVGGALAAALAASDLRPKSRLARALTLVRPGLGWLAGPSRPTARPA